MNRSNQPIDEYTLAAFIAGTLSEERRREVIVYLAEHPEARTLLHMAYEAMEAAPTPAPVRAEGDGADREATPALPPPRHDRTAQPRTWGRYLTASLALVLVGIGLGVLLDPPRDGTRTPQLAEDARLVVEVDQPDLSFSWNAVPNAYVYRVVIWDPIDVRVVDEHETTVTRLKADAPFMQTLRSNLTAGRRYSIRVDAINAQQRQIQTAAVDFVYSRPD